MVAVARCCESIHAREVASLVALSSSKAFSRIALILRLCQSILSVKPFQGAFGLFYHDMQFCYLLLQALYNIRWSFREELLVSKLPL